MNSFVSNFELNILRPPPFNLIAFFATKLKFFEPSRLLIYSVVYIFTCKFFSFFERCKNLPQTLLINSSNTLELLNGKTRNFAKRPNFNNSFFVKSRLKNLIK